MIKRLVDYNDKSSEKGDRQDRRSPAMVNWDGISLHTNIVLRLKYFNNTVVQT